MITATIEQQLTQLESDRQDLVDNLETKGITGLTGDETFTELVPEVLNIPSGEIAYAPDGILFYGTTAKQNDMYSFLENINFSKMTSMKRLFYTVSNLTSIPLIDTSNVTNMSEIFANTTSLKSIPLIDTSNVTNMYRAFYRCQNLNTVPQLDISSVTNLQETFYYCNRLSNDSLNNILAMCINATSYTGTKTLKFLGFSSTYYSTSKIEALSNYQDFIDAGWTIGY